MANVGNLKKSPQYNADLILQRSGTSLKVIFGSEAEKVDTVEFTFLSDPLHFRKITSSDSRITVSSLGDGIFHIVKILDGQSIMAGSVVAELQADVDI